MNGTQNLNIDSKTLEQCLKSISNFGSTTYHNICTGQTYLVPMGGLDWLELIILSAIGISITLLFMVILFKTTFDL